jgi:multiple sugar transport system permease protein
VKERKPKPLWWRRWGEETFAAYLFLLPSILIFAVFTIFPAIFSVGVSMFRWNMPARAVFSWFNNYRLLFTDPIEAPLFLKSILNTFYFALGVPISLVISLLIALLLNRKFRGIGIFRTAFFLPTIASVTAVSVVWLWLFHPDQPWVTHPALVT